ncbi:ap2 domain transcription factor ap2x-2 [Cystoisospora suis]|uniref:Ap2 domain transcription factor ap2x-2 n=1 Tax=Cystoisospora suis TaxID=483139 RepID=A0A2C6L0I9_9APIC|nr:ap2 domain transcription factor ap2x-2 [Cystoisospora suis]
MSVPGLVESSSRVSPEETDTAATSSQGRDSQKFLTPQKRHRVLLSSIAGRTRSSSRLLSRATSAEEPATSKAAGSLEQEREASVPDTGATWTAEQDEEEGVAREDKSTETEELKCLQRGQRGYSRLHRPDTPGTEEDPVSKRYRGLDAGKSKNPRTSTRSLSESLDVFVTEDLPSEVGEFVLPSHFEDCDEADREEFLNFIKREQAAIDAQNRHGGGLQEDAALSASPSGLHQFGPEELSNQGRPDHGEETGNGSEARAQPDEDCLEKHILVEEADKEEAEAACNASVKAEPPTGGQSARSICLGTESPPGDILNSEVQRRTSESTAKVLDTPEPAFVRKGGTVLEEEIASGRNTRRRAARCRLAAWAVERRQPTSSSGLLRAREVAGEEVGGSDYEKDKDHSQLVEGEEDQQRTNSREDELSAGATEKRLGVHYSRYDKSWVARYTHGGRVLKKYFSAKVYGYELARAKAIEARLHMEKDAQLWSSFYPGSRSPPRPAADTSSSTRVTTRSNSTVTQFQTDSASPLVSPSEQQDTKGANYGSPADRKEKSGAAATGLQTTSQSGWDLATGDAFSSMSTGPCLSGALSSAVGVSDPLQATQQQKTPQQFQHPANQPERGGAISAPLGMLVSPVPVVSGALHTRVGGTTPHWTSSLALETSGTGVESGGMGGDQLSLAPESEKPVENAEAGSAEGRSGTRMIREARSLDGEEPGTEKHIAALKRDERSDATVADRRKARLTHPQPVLTTSRFSASVTSEARNEDSGSLMRAGPGPIGDVREGVCSAGYPLSPSGTGANTPSPELASPLPAPRFAPSWPREVTGSQVHPGAVGGLGGDSRTEVLPLPGGSYMTSPISLAMPAVSAAAGFSCLPGTASSVPVGGIPGVFFPAVPQPAFAPYCFMPTPCLPLFWRGGSFAGPDCFFPGVADTLSPPSACGVLESQAGKTAGLLGRGAEGAAQAGRTQGVGGNVDTGKPDRTATSRSCSPEKEPNLAGSSTGQTGANCKQVESELTADFSSTGCPSPEYGKRVLHEDAPFTSNSQFRSFHASSAMTNVPLLGNVTAEGTSSGLFNPYFTQSTPGWPCATVAAYSSFVPLAGPSFPIPCIVPQTLFGWPQTPSAVPGPLPSPEVRAGNTALQSAAFSPQPSPTGSSGTRALCRSREYPVSEAGSGEALTK